MTHSHQDPDTSVATLPNGVRVPSLKSGKNSKCFPV